jgi:glycerol-3-phosphate O-acyltransferase
VECYLVPIDVCYQLVGTVRVYWKGFDGGQEARERIDGFFAGIRSQAKQFSSEE